MLKKFDLYPSSQKTIGFQPVVKCCFDEIPRETSTFNLVSALHCFLFLLISIFSYSNIFSKQVLCQASSKIKQVSFNVRDGELIFTEKYQNINGTVTESWRINDEEVSDQDFNKRMVLAQKEEEETEKEELERKKLEQEEKMQEFLAQKRKEEEEFAKQTRLQTLKKLVVLELETAEDCFKKLDKYQLESYFVFETDSFSSLESLHDSKVVLTSQARELTIRPTDELKKDELKNVLSDLESVPEKIERFFRQSVKYAINNCNDTKRLKELLALI